MSELPEKFLEPGDVRRWFSVYRSHVFTEKGVRTTRAFGGKNMRCYHNLEVVLHVARKWMPARPDAQAFIYEVFPLEGDPPLEEYKGQAATVSDEPDPNARPLSRSWRWTKFGRRTRLVLLETLVQPPHRVVALTEELITRGPFDGLLNQFAAKNRKRSGLDPSA